MAKKPKCRKANDSPEGVWIAPRHSLKGPKGERAWEDRPGGPPSNSRFLEMADIALGLKKPTTKKHKAVAAGAHVTNKTEPYAEAKIISHFSVSSGNITPSWPAQKSLQERAKRLQNARLETSQKTNRPKN
jgi:hypothetical protein